MKRRRFSLRTDDKTEPQLRPERLCSLCNRKSTTSSSRSRHIWHCHRETGKVSHRGLKSGEGAHEPYISTSRAGCPPIHLHAYLSAATPAALCAMPTQNATVLREHCSLGAKGCDIAFIFESKQMTSLTCRGA